MQCRTTHSLCVPIILGLLTATAGAQPVTWDGQIDSNWYNPINWDPNAFPADDANRLVSFGSPVASTAVRADYGGAITVTSAAGSATFEAQLYIGDASTGTLDILDGAAVSSPRGYIATEANAVGEVNVDGAGWDCSDWIEIGNRGVGTLRIEGGGEVTTGAANVGRWPGGKGTAAIDGEGSALSVTGNLHVGHSGEGNMSGGHGLAQQELNSHRAGDSGGGRDLGRAP